MFVPKREIIRRLKKSPSGEEAKDDLRSRMAWQLMDYKQDPLTDRLRPYFDKYREHLTGSILDVGCYTGILYHWLDRPKGYTGIDIWPEAIAVALEVAPGGDFRVADLKEISGAYDVVWSSQIEWSPEEIDKLKSLGRKHVIINVKQGLEEICGPNLS